MSEETLEPDYSDYDEDDDVLDDFPDDEEGIEIERMLDEQNNLVEELDLKIELDDRRDQRKEESMSSSPFPSSAPSWSQEKAPWDQNKPNQSPGWGSSSPFGGGSSNPWGGGGTSIWNQPKQQTPQPVNNPIGGPFGKKAVVCDVLDCLYESWESGGKPNILPRGIFDLKPKFDVWDRIASFNPQKLYIIFPAAELVPGLGSDRAALQITLDYISQCVSTYIRIPRSNCVVLQQMRQFLPKETSLKCAMSDWKNVDDMVYIGVHSGRWGLSSRDIEAARNLNISYIDIYKLLEGKYEYE